MWFLLEGEVILKYFNCRERSLWVVFSEGLRGIFKSLGRLGRFLGFRVIVLFLSFFILGMV